MVLGTPITLILALRAAISSAIASAPRSVPSPPMQKSRLIFIDSRVSTMSGAAWLPREELSMVPPRLWMSSTSAGESSSGA